MRQLFLMRALAVPVTNTRSSCQVAPYSGGYYHFTTSLSAAVKKLLAIFVACFFVLPITLNAQVNVRPQSPDARIDSRLDVRDVYGRIDPMARHLLKYDEALQEYDLPPENRRLLLQRYASRLRENDRDRLHAQDADLNALIDAIVQDEDSAPKPHDFSGRQPLLLKKRFEKRHSLFGNHFESDGATLDDAPAYDATPRIQSSTRSESALVPMAAPSFTDCASQTQVSESECDALVAFYESTGGDGWENNENWLTGPISTWFGISVEGNLLRLSDDRPAFVEVAGPGGADPCGAGAGSTDGCAEVGGNAVFQSPNSTGEYLLSTADPAPGPEATLPFNAPNEFELRFTEGTSVALHLFTSLRVIQVPFEVWDIGPTDPFGVNDPSDDVRLIPALFSDGGGECEFGYGETVDFFNGLPATDRIYAYYPAPGTSYADWEAVTLPEIEASPDGCPITSEPFFEYLDLPRIRPLQRMVLADVGGSGALPAAGTTIRFYTEDLLDLTGIRFSDNNLTGEIPPEIGQLTNLRSFELPFNGLLGGTIPPEIGALGELQSLFLSGCPLEGEIPPEIGNLSNLELLNISFMNLSGPIPPELGSLTRLIILNADFNQLSGAIPPEIGGLPNLRRLNLGFNQLDEPIPAELGDLPSIVSLELFGNQLPGAIPPELGQLATLEELDLSRNLLSGSIPPELGNLSSLRILFLSFNALSGSIPPELGNFPSLELLVLNSNQLTGTIPSALGNLGNLVNLSLSGNLLTGAIPPELGGLPVFFLELEDNMLDGPIPPEFGNLPNIISLDLSGNELSGAIPPELENLSPEGGPLGINFSGNHLSGAIPPELGNVSRISNLNLSGNALDGSIPPELGNLAQMEVVNLSGNALSGAIPPELGNLTGTLLLNFSNNKLSGAIPAELGSVGADFAEFLPVIEFDLSGNSLGSLVPLPVAALGAKSEADPYFFYCALTGNRPSLFIPDTPEYAALTTNDAICGLPLLSLDEVAGRLLFEVDDLFAADLINKGVSNALSAKLRAAIAYILAGDFDEAVDVLGAFQNQLGALVNSRRLTPEQAQPLIDAARALAGLLDPDDENSEEAIAGPAEPTALTAFSLDPSYPNPFNPSTTVSFTVPESSPIQVAVFDLLGRQVRVLVDGQVEAGQHRVTLHASELPSGTYFVRMQTPAQTFTRKIILSK